MPTKEINEGEQLATKVKGEMKKEAIVRTSPKEDIVNTPTVDDVKKLSKKGGLYDHITYNEATNTIEFGSNGYFDGGLDVAYASTFDAPVTFEDTTQFNKAVTIGTSATNANLDVKGTITGNTLSINSYARIPVLLGQTNTLRLGDNDTAQNVIIGNASKLGQPISYDDFMTNLDTTHHTFSNFSAFKIGQFVYVNFKFQTSSYDATHEFMNIKTPYRPKYGFYKRFSGTVGLDNAKTWFGSNGNVYTTDQSATGNNDTMSVMLFYEIA